MVTERLLQPLPARARRKTMKKKYLPVAILLSVLPLASLAGCRKSPEEPAHKPPPPPQVSRFTPPPDGKLTEKQIELFLEVRPREKQIADQTRDAAADVRAARELRRNPAEYQWVKARIVEAVLARVTSDWESMDAPSRDAMLEGMERVRDTIRDREDRAALERRMAQLRGAAPEPPASPALRHNVDLVARHQEEMLRVEVWSLLAEEEG
jgi:hypothetical protein